MPFTASSIGEVTVLPIPAKTSFWNDSFKSVWRLSCFPHTLKFTAISPFFSYATPRFMCSSGLNGSSRMIHFFL